MLSQESVGLWWPVLIGTATFLILAGGLVLLLVKHHSIRQRIQRESMEALEKRAQQYSDLFNNVTDMVYVHSLDGEILQINRAVTTFFGLDAKELIGRSLFTLIEKRFHAAVSNYLQQLSGNEPGETEGTLPIRSRLDHRWHIFEYRSSIVSDTEAREAKRSVRGIARDITDRIENERSLGRKDRRMNALLREAQMMQENLSTLSQTILRVREEERRRISRELHDEVGQILTATNVNLEIMKRDLKLDIKSVERRIADTRQLIAQVMDSLRKVLRELRPEALDQLGLIPAITRYANDFSHRTGICVDISQHDNVEQLSLDQKVALYRVVQESLNNTAKHAHAQHVQIEIRRTDGNVVMNISDDGTGFDLAPAKDLAAVSTTHFGLLGMREHVHIVSGKFEMKSQKGEGTQIHVEIPASVAGTEQHD